MIGLGQRTRPNKKAKTKEREEQQASKPEGGREADNSRTEGERGSRAGPREPAGKQRTDTDGGRDKTPDKDNDDDNKQAKGKNGRSRSSEQRSTTQGHRHRGPELPGT